MGAGKRNVLLAGGAGVLSACVYFWREISDFFGMLAFFFGGGFGR